MDFVYQQHVQKDFIQAYSFQMIILLGKIRKVCSVSFLTDHRLLLYNLYIPQQYKDVNNK